jgi:hypothetical protein
MRLLNPPQREHIMQIIRGSSADTRNTNAFKPGGHIDMVKHRPIALQKNLAASGGD